MFEVITAAVAGLILVSIWTNGGNVNHEGPFSGVLEELEELEGGEA